MKRPILIESRNGKLIIKEKENCWGLRQSRGMGYKRVEETLVQATCVPIKLAAVTAPRV